MDLGEADSSEPLLLVDSGYLRVRIGSSGEPFEFAAHWTTDPLLKIATCASLLVSRYSETASALLHDEQEGCFLDIVSAPRESLSLAVHKIAGVDADRTGRSLFSAVRGEAVFEGLYRRQDFFESWTLQLWSLRVLEIDVFGYVGKLNRPFPQVEFERLYAGVRREYGLNLPAPQEVRDRGADPLRQNRKSGE
jgi:hypothetical protein